MPFTFDPQALGAEVPEVLAAIRDYLEGLNVVPERTFETSMAIHGIDEAILWLGALYGEEVP